MIDEVNQDSCRIKYTYAFRYRGEWAVRIEQLIAHGIDFDLEVMYDEVAVDTRYRIIIRGVKSSTIERIFREPIQYSEDPGFEFNYDNLVPSRPEWEEMLVICDNCGHAIHVMNEQSELIRCKEEQRLGRMKLSEAIELLQKLNKCWDDCPPDATECKKCAFFVDDASGKEAIKTALFYLALIKEKEPEQKKGEWIKNDNGTYSCSACHSWIPEEQYHYARYCLYCGADMRERRTDEQS